MQDAFPLQMNDFDRMLELELARRLDRVVRTFLDFNRPVELRLAERPLGYAEESGTGGRKRDRCALSRPSCRVRYGRFVLG